jgi:hypothetical protein
MADNTKRDDSAQPESNPLEPLEAPVEGGRAMQVESSPEGRAMQIETIGTPGEESQSRGAERSASDAVDDRAAEKARMDVRRREHSAD